MFENAKVAVIGDLILDEYISGDVTRISPEAPVPVHNAQRVHLQAGGAANTALNLHLLGAKTHLIGVVGQDAAAEELRKVLESESLDTQHLVSAIGHSTIKKTRITAGRQQIVRIDWEKKECLPNDAILQCCKHLETLDFNVMLISDYGKGLVTQDSIRAFIKIAKDKKAIILVDPKSQDFSMYQGADLITPNLKEAKQATHRSNLEDPKAVACSIQSTYKIPNVLITLGAQGMILLDAKSNVHRLPAQTFDVFDVSGAGDTVVATIAAALGSGSFTMVQAMELANTAAGVVVQKWGTQPIRLDELLAKIQSQDTESQSKILDLPTLKSVLGTKKLRTKKIVFTNGCFDILHFGHLKYLEKAKQLGDLLVVGINSDLSVKTLKGPERPIQPLNHRAGLLAGLQCVDYVVAFEEETPHALIKSILPDVLVKGADYDVHSIIGAQDVIASGGEVVTIDLVPGLSTSYLVAKASGK